ncbi:unnamed protein product [Caenorhabditis bovis]|uniref:C3H1-type domain-containing protein n=1 Tax=Caenorhabditis bovis TaxID=2654633 RepID=A0A8S1EJW7_9PELO|nr:unnamed protein product [Caenorhabditis bovis]
MQIENLEEFNKWIVKEITPVCDADPEALAKYVLALIKKPNKNEEELKSLSLEQLDIFLGKETSKFVEKLFAALKSKAYLSSTSSSDADSNSADVNATIEEKKIRKDNIDTATVENVAEPTTALSDKLSEPTGRNIRTNISRSESNGVAKENSPVKPFSSRGTAENGSSKPVRKRISPPPPENRDRNGRDRRRSRSPGRDRRRNGRSASNERDRHRGERRRSRSRSDSRSPPSRRRRNGPRSGADEVRRRCKAFEDRGFCMRGEQCPYYHGPDPVVVDETALSNLVSIPQPATNFSLPPPGYNPVNPPPPGVGILVPPPVAEYNPETPALTIPQYTVPPPPIAAPTWQNPAPTAYVPQPTQNGAYYPPPAAPQIIQNPPFRGSSGARGARGGRGGRGGGRGGFVNNVNRDSTTLQVAKIPPELNNIAKLNEHFAEFGNIENIQVRYNGDAESALITYSNRHEAFKAYKSPTPVLNNRFIKVFWHKPQEGGEENGAAPQQPQAPPAPTEKPKIATVKESKFVCAEVQNQRKQVQEAKEKLTREKEQLAKLVDLQEKQNSLLEKWMEKQKALLVKARSSVDENEKKNATKLVKQIHKKIKACKEEVDGILMQISEKTMAVDQAMAALEALKVTPPESRKRRASTELEDEGSTKMSSVVVIRGIMEEDVTDVMNHMEKFGETFDTSVKVDDGLAVATIPYKRNEDAQKAISEGKIFNGVELDMVLTKEQFDVPLTDSNMSANELLASIPNGVESDDDDLLND